MKKTLFVTYGLLALLLYSGCNRKFSDSEMATLDTTLNNSGSASIMPATVVTGIDRLWIATTNMQTDRIEMYDPTATDWNVASALLWSWKPTTALGYSSPEVSAWGDPMEVKQRRIVGWSGTYLATVGGGLATIVAYPSGTKKWALNVGGYPHAADILPNGNIAIAVYHGNWIRVYASSQGASNATYAQFNLNWARGLLYDPINSLLWVLGENELTALTVGGTRASPTLTEVTAKRTALPTNTKGVDLSPVYGDLNKLWVSTNDGLYIYDKTTAAFTAQPGAAFRTAVNGISNQPYGDIVETRPDSACSLNGWCTNHVDFYNSAGAFLYSRAVNNAAFSKARTISQYYQTRAEYAFATYNVRVITTLDDPDNSWSGRHALVADMVRKYNFDLFGVQEPKGTQIDNMVSDLPDYTRFGVSDHNDYAYQHQDIFYKTAMFNLLQSGKFWMAPGGPTTPPASRPWDNEYDACVCTWGKFEDRSTGYQFYVFNTHFDPGGPTAKQESANLMMSKIQSIAGTSPVIFMGDLNTNQTTAPYATIVNTSLFDDTYDLAGKKAPVSRQTGNWWNINPPGNSQIDQLFVTSHWQVKSHYVLWDNYNGKLPSDHFPVLVEMHKNQP